MGLFWVLLIIVGGGVASYLGESSGFGRSYYVYYSHVGWCGEDWLRFIHVGFTINIPLVTTIYPVILQPIISLFDWSERNELSICAHYRRWHHWNKKEFNFKKIWAPKTKIKRHYPRDVSVCSGQKIDNSFLSDQSNNEIMAQIIFLSPPELFKVSLVSGHFFSWPI